MTIQKAQIQIQIQQHYGEALSIVIKKVGQVQLAEDAMQEASIKALKQWPDELPDSPRAWLITVAYRYCLDFFRKQQNIKQHQQSLTSYQDKLLDDDYSVLEAREIEDQLLQLIFMCCHPAIAVENQIAMTLKMVMGFNVKDIARALLLPQKTIEQRLTRAKNKIDVTQIDFALPHQNKMVLRLPSVLKTLYLIFNEGHQPTSGTRLIDEILCEQAIRLLRSLCRIFRGQASALALLSLMLFVDARNPARSKHKFISLQKQNRSLYKHQQIIQADIILQKSFKLGEVSSYHIHAAIAGLHSQASSYATTDWQQIELLYHKLNQYQCSAVIQLNLAVVLLELGKLAQAETIIKQTKQTLTKYPSYYMALAQLEKNKGNNQLAIQAIIQAKQLSQNKIEIDYFEQSIKTIQENIK